MRNRNTCRLIGLALLMLALPAHADAPVWKVSKGDHELYIGGTIHLLGQDDYPLPAAFDIAYAQASRLVLETDMQEIESPAFQQEMLRAMLYPDGTTLQQVLQPETWAMLQAHLAARELPIESFAKFRPGMVMVTLTIMELQRLGLAGTGVDSFYSRRALNDDKTLGKLETAQAQLDFMKSMGEGEEDALVRYALEDIERMGELMPAMKTAWRRGDLDALESLALEPWQAQFPALDRVLLVDRNRAWLPEIEAMLATREVELVLVGALHLLGDDGLLALLEKRGCRIEQLNGVAVQ